MIEKRLKEICALSASLALGLGATACSSDASSSKPSTNHKKAQVHPSPKVPNVQVRYFPNGSRELYFDNINNTTVGGMLNSGNYLDDIYEWCDGKDMMEETASASNGPESFQRIVNYPACADGRLTPADFPPTPSETLAK